MNEVYILVEEPWIKERSNRNKQLIMLMIEFTSKRSNRIRPSKLICLFSRRPNCFDWRTVVRAVVLTSFLNNKTTVQDIFWWSKTNFQTAQICERRDVQMFCTRKYIIKIKILNIVTSNNIWINFTNKIRPFLEEQTKPSRFNEFHERI